MADPVMDVQSLTNAVKKLTDNVNNLSKALSKANSSFTANGFAPGGMGGGYGGYGGGGIRMGGLAVSNGWGGRIAAVGMGAFGAAWSATPDLGTTIGRAAGYYGAARMGVNMSRAKLQMTTLGALGGGISGVGDDAAAAAMLVNGYYYNPGSTAYIQTMREIGGAAKYLNMNNAQAAQAIGGLQTGSMGGNLYQYGIQVYNPKTGRGRSTAEIGDQLYNLIFAGKTKGLTKKDVQSSLQWGFAGANLRNMGLSPDQQQIFAQYFLDKVSGKNGDLRNADNLANQAGNKNPALDVYRLNASTTSLYQASEQNMLKGFNTATNQIVAFNAAMKDVIATLSTAKGYFQGIGGSNWGGSGNILSSAANMGMAYLFGRGMRGGAGGAAKGAGKFLKGAAGKVLAPLGGALAAGDSKNFNWGDFAKSVGTSAAIGEVLGGAETFGVSGLVTGGLTAAGYLGKWAWNNISGGAGEIAPSSFGAKGGPANQMAVQAPISGAKVSATYGQKGAMWSSGSHTGQDYPCPIGTPVKAAADGVAIARDIGSAYGMAIVLDHGNGITTIYGHLSQKNVNAGEKVTRGQVIGKSGKSGNVSGPHLHFEVRKNDHPIDPAAWLNGAVKDANPANKGAGSTVGSGSVASQVLGNAPGINLSSNYSLVDDLFQNATLSTLNSSNPGSAKASNSQGSADIILGTGDQRAWATKLLSRLGAPSTDENVNAITTWMRYEGGHWKNSAHYNPLNTTQPEQGATSMNRVGVKAYKNWDQGLDATVTTLRNGKYANILSALMQGTNAQAVLQAVNNSPWGTNIAMGGPAGYGASGAAVPTAPGIEAVRGSFQRTGGGASGGSSNVNIYVTLQHGSDQEAMLLAKKVKRYLDNDHEISVLGGVK